MRTKLDTILHNSNNDTIDYERALKIFYNHDFHPIYCQINKGAELFRIRENDEKPLYLKIAEIANPKPCFVNNFSRANRPKQSVFYCAEHKDISQLELLDNFIKKRNICDTQNMTYSKWETKRDLKLLLIYNPLKNLNTGFNVNFKSLFHDFIGRFSDSDEDYIKSYYSTIADYFSTPLFDSEKIYYVTSAFHNFAKSVEYFDGIIYPSVQSLQSGYNIAFDSKIVENNDIVLSSVWINSWTKEDNKQVMLGTDDILGQINGENIIWK
jgi:hypothetical protein